jgi:CheY-like chemotaxis protein
MMRILYVEDQPLLQLDGEGSLIAAGYDVVVASNGEEACAHLRGPGPGFDGIVTDIDLPGSAKGWRVAELGREIAAGMAVIYVTGEAGRDFERLGVPHSLLVSKPFEWDGLVPRLSRLLAA